MVPTLLAAVVAVVLRSLAAVRLQRLNIGTPVVMVLCGAVVGSTVESSVGAVLNTGAALTVAELILAVLLFVDASEVRGGRLWGASPGLAGRLLLVALPLSLLAAVGAGAVLFPELSLPVLLVLACVVMPVDFAASEDVLRDDRLPSRLRTSLNVEGGYNDGILSPLFLFALVLAGGTAGHGGSGDHGTQSAARALTTAVPQALTAVAVGVAAGVVLRLVLEFATERGWTSGQSRRVVVLLAPLLVYTGALACGGNGFVAAFVCGLVFRYVRRLIAARRALRPGSRDVRPDAEVHSDHILLEDVTSLLTTAMWFVVGIAVVYLVGAVDLPVLAYCLLALTVLRVVPVVVALTGSSLGRRERLLAGALGPRGTTTIVFGLLAFNRLPDGLPSDTILITTLLCVLGSVLLHGLGAGPLTARLAPPQRARG